MRPSLIAIALVLPACHASVSAKANTNGDATASAEMNETSSTPETTTSTAPAPTPVTAKEPAQATTQVSSACPFECFIADGASQIALSAEEQQRLQGAFAGTMSGIHQCVGGGAWQRRRSSPVLNVRVNFKGEVTDVGVDSRGYDTYDSCIEGVQRPLPDGTFSGPSTIRCAERCAAPARATMKARTRATSAKPAAASQAAPAPSAPQAAPAP